MANREDHRWKLDRRQRTQPEFNGI
ncbi:hypothetical protein CCACVL1_13853 [Corchorus capsularis]|uniref:Uncharacterized protein n=1 Tax=Corchorus capsularis TaxID=210143 RepID=A0A1R3I9F6_COCAP|nr:hypothetical protein CCACVL1_13853 [Corchorus capsularis]